MYVPSKSLTPYMRVKTPLFSYSMIISFFWFVKNNNSTSDKSSTMTTPQQVQHPSQEESADTTTPRVVSPTSVAKLIVALEDIAQEGASSSNVNSSATNSFASKILKKKKKKNTPKPTSQTKTEYINVEILIPTKSSSKFPIPTVVQFQLTADILELREEEMRSIANDALIPLDRWNGSLIYRKWKAELSATTLTHQHEKKKQSAKRTTRVVTIEPPSEIQLIWSQEFLTSLNQFYETVNYHVPETISGRVFLVLSEYFGIVHSPTKVTYASYGAFLKMKVWVDYLSQRADMASYIIQQCMSRTKLTHTFVTTTDPSESTAGFSYYIEDRPCNDIFDGNLLINQTSEDAIKTHSCSVVYDFFNDTENITTVESKNESFAQVLRQDFSEYLEKALPGSKVTFESVQVKLKTKVLMLSIGPRAVLTVVAAAPTLSADAVPLSEHHKNMSPCDTIVEAITTTSAHPLYEELEREQQQPLPLPPSTPTMKTQENTLMGRLMSEDHLINANDDNIESCNAQWLTQCLDMCDLFSSTTNTNFHPAVAECSNKVEHDAMKDCIPLKPVNLNKTNSIVRPLSTPRTSHGSNTSLSHHSQHSVHSKTTKSLQEVTQKDGSHHSKMNSSNGSVSHRSQHSIHHDTKCLQETPLEESNNHNRIDSSRTTASHHGHQPVNPDKKSSQLAPREGRNRHKRESSSSSRSQNSVDCNTSTDDSDVQEKRKSSGRRETIQITTSYSQLGKKKFTIQISSDSSSDSNKKKSAPSKRKKKIVASRKK